MLRSLDGFCNWLSATGVSQAIQRTEWVIPAVQTVHILAVAAIMSSMLLVDLRLIGVRARGDSVAAVASRFIPVVWYALPILLLTGGTLIIAEPSRSLQNPVFLVKMSLLVLAVGLTLICQLPLRRDIGFWDASSRRAFARVIGWLSFPIWVAIVFAGRWIAYVQSH